MTTQTISILTQDKKVILVKVKREVTYTVPPPPSEKVDKALTAFKGQPVDYPQLAKRRTEFVQKIREQQANSDGLWKKE